MATKKNKPTVVVEATTEDKVKNIKCDDCPRFTLKQLVESNRYKKYAYVLEASLSAEETYTLAEVDKLISGMI